LSLHKHVEAGVRAAAAANALWLPTGGDTRPETALSEAASYRDVAIAQKWWGADLTGRVHPEIHARDSLANLVLALALFRAVTGRYPRRIVVTSFGFKAARFRHHAATLGIPAECFTYLAVNDPPPPVLADARSGEMRKYEALTHDPYLRSEVYRAQRAARNPRRLALPRYGTELDPLIQFLYGDDLYLPVLNLTKLLTQPYGGRQS